MKELVLESWVAFTEVNMGEILTAPKTGSTCPDWPAGRRP